MTVSMMHVADSGGGRDGAKRPASRLAAWGTAVETNVGGAATDTNKWLAVSPTTSSSSYTNSPASSEPQQETRLIHFINQLYKRWARIITRNSVLVVVLCSVLSLVGTYFIVKTPHRNDITGYTPYGARSRDEWEMSQAFFAENGPGISVFLLVLPKNRSRNMLEPDNLDEVLRVEDLVTRSRNFTLLNHNTNHWQNFDEFCYSFCLINEPFVQYVRALRIQQDRLAEGSGLDERIQLGYPNTFIYDQRFNIQPNFFGIKLADSKNRLLLGGDGGGSSNKTANSTGQLVSNLVFAEMIALQLRAERIGDWTVDEVKKYEQSISDYFLSDFKSDKVRVLTLSTTYVETEVVRAGLSMLPFLVVGFAIMAVVSTITTFLSATYMQQWTIHKFTLAIMACVCPFMACGTALGTMFLFGVRFGSILCVTPFLVLAIGVDDAYLMIHAWQRVTKQLAKKQPSTPVSSERKLALVLQETGPAILISALTNILADSVGTFTGSPEITLLCYGNMACLAVDFLYQITFYSAIMTLVDYFETRQQRRVAAAEVKERESSLKISIRPDNTVVIEDCRSCRTNLASDACHARWKKRLDRFLEVYVSILTNRLVALLTVVAWVVYLLTCAKYISGMSVDLTPRKLFSLTSPLIEMDDIRLQSVLPHYTLATIFVNNPGNLESPERRAQLEQFVHELESLPGSWGNVSTNFFLRDFVAFEQFQAEMDGRLEEEGGENNLVRMEDLDEFIAWPQYVFWRGFLRFKQPSHNRTDANGVAAPTELSRFFFTVAFHGNRMKEWDYRGRLLALWREVVDNYKPLFNTSVFYEDSLYLDLINNMPTDMWQSAVATLGCMAFVCFVFMYDTLTVCVTTAGIASIMAGILGSLAAMGYNMDPIMMAALVISIGFSVDIPAHVAYHYHAAGLHATRAISVRERLHDCLVSVGAPALQAALSTNLCVLSLRFVPLYMSEIFVHTMVLCICLCVVHGLWLIPCVLSLFHPLLQLICGRRAKRSHPSSTNNSDWNVGYYVRG